MAKKKGKFGIISISSGLFLMVISYLIYAFSSIQYLLEVQSEIFGAGIALLVLGVIWFIFGIKAG